MQQNRQSQPIKCIKNIRKGSSPLTAPRDSVGGPAMLNMGGEEGATSGRLLMRLLLRNATIVAVGGGPEGKHGAEMDDVCDFIALSAERSFSNIDA